MSEAVAAVSSRVRCSTGTLLLAGVVMATLTEAIAGTVLSLGRDDIIGDTHATPDEFAWLDFGYLALKMIGFMTAPWLLSRVNSRSLIIIATLAMGAASAIAAIATQLELLAALRMIQGFCGATLLIAGQAAIFLTYPHARQPLLQAVFAMGSVVAPAALAPALEGWLLDTLSWNWIFLSIVPLCLAAVGILLLADAPSPPASTYRPFDWIGALLISAALFCLTYVLTQGSRWDWFEEPHVLWLTVLGAASLLAFLARQTFADGSGLIRFTPFKVEDFCFAFVVSFVAGAALFGSAFVIPVFARGVLDFTYIDVGALLLPGAALFSGSLLIAAFFFQFYRVPPIATVPFGILMIMTAMWMLSGTTTESGAGDMMAAILLRGCGLGFLFLSITLTAFMKLDSGNLAFGIAIFNAGRQLGGLIGVAVLETLIDHHVAGNVSVLGASVSAGVPAVGERLAVLRAVLAEHGMEPTTSGRAAMVLMDRAIIGEATVIAFNAAFNAVALLFVFAAPCLIGIKIVLHRLRHQEVSHAAPFAPAGVDHSIPDRVQSRPLSEAAE
jgi:DHA2 family multidrug resistance protein